MASEPRPQVEIPGGGIDEERIACGSQDGIGPRRAIGRVALEEIRPHHRTARGTPGNPGGQVRQDVIHHCRAGRRVNGDAGPGLVAAVDRVVDDPAEGERRGRRSGGVAEVTDTAAAGIGDDVVLDDHARDQLVLVLRHEIDQRTGVRDVSGRIGRAGFDIDPVALRVGDEVRVEDQLSLGSVLILIALQAGASFEHLYVVDVHAGAIAPDELSRFAATQ